MGQGLTRANPWGFLLWLHLYPDTRGLASREIWRKTVVWNWSPWHSYSDLADPSGCKTQYRDIHCREGGRGNWRGQYIIWYYRNIN